MDPHYPDQSANKSYSHNPRSRDDSRTSPPTTEALFQSLRLAESSTAGTPSFDTSSFSSSRPPSSRELVSPAFHSPNIPHSTSFLPGQHSRPNPAYHPSSHHHSSANVGTPTWFNAEGQPQSRDPPLLRVEPAPEELPLPTSSPPLPSIETGAMSAVALSYDAGFSMGSRSSFTWPGVGDEQAQGLLGPHLSHYASDASLTPPSGSRSVTASPPRNSLTAEQRELKRQRDQARHNSKMQARGRRTGSGSSSLYSPPPHLSELVTGASSMPVYTTAPPQISLLAEPPTSQYLPPFQSPLPDHNQSGMFQSQSHHYPPPSYMAEYSYPPSSGPGMPSHYGRTMTTDPSMAMYQQAPPVMGAGSHDANGQVRVVAPKPKPQCWEHGCNGRQFSTFSNLLRHQREKSGQATKATCPNCGAEFTRTTARNGHLLHDKCKQKSSKP